MELSAALNAHIRHLYVSMDGDHEEALAWVGALHRDLRNAVPSYLGLQLTMVEHGLPIVLTDFAPTVRAADIRSSLRMALVPLGVSGADPDSAIAFYAGTPGAFVDLAADVGYALRTAVGPWSDATSEQPQVDQAPIRVDDPVQPTTTLSGLEGAVDLSTVNRAIGLLIGDGYQSQDMAVAELVRLATVAGVTVLAIATELVRPSPH